MTQEVSNHRIGNYDVVVLKHPLGFCFEAYSEFAPTIYGNEIHACETACLVEAEKLLSSQGTLF
jgi:hypothetical protein